jgi:hypothetical protein
MKLPHSIAAGASAGRGTELGKLQRAEGTGLLLINDRGPDSVFPAYADS